MLKMKQKKYLLILIFWILGNLVLQAQEFGKIDTIISLKVPVSKSLCAQVFTTKKILVFGGVLGTAFITEKWIKKNLQSHKAPFFNQYANVWNEFGEKKYVIPAVVGTWVFGSLMKDTQLSNTAMNSCKAILCGAIITESVKIISGRVRPYESQNNMDFHFFRGLKRNRYKSFPSGHTFLAFATFTPFAETYSKWLYAIPISVGFARVYKNKHWFSDVILGGGLGYFIGQYFYKRKNQKVIFTGNGFVIKF